MDLVQDGSVIVIRIVIFIGFSRKSNKHSYRLMRVLAYLDAVIVAVRGNTGRNARPAHWADTSVSLHEISHGYAIILEANVCIYITNCRSHPIPHLSRPSRPENSIDHRDQKGVSSESANVAGFRLPLSGRSQKLRGK